MPLPSVSKTYRRRRFKIFALTFDDLEGTIADQRGFPIKIETNPTGGTVTDGLLGPLPVIEIKWVDPATNENRNQIVAHNTVILARMHTSFGVYRHPHEGTPFIDFMDYDEFFGKYIPTEQEN